MKMNNSPVQDLRSVMDIRTIHTFFARNLLVRHPTRHALGQSDIDSIRMDEKRRRRSFDGRETFRTFGEFVNHYLFPFGTKDRNIFAKAINLRLIDTSLVRAPDNPKHASGRPSLGVFQLEEGKNFTTSRSTMSVTQASRYEPQMSYHKRLPSGVPVPLPAQ